MPGGTRRRQVVLFGDRTKDEYILRLRRQGGYAASKDTETPSRDWQNHDQWRRFTPAQAGVDMAAEMLGWYSDTLDVIRPTISPREASLTSLAFLGQCKIDESTGRPTSFQGVQTNHEPETSRLRVREFAGYKGRPSPRKIAITVPDRNVRPDVIAISDAGNELRHSQDDKDNAFCALMDRLAKKHGDPAQIVMKMHLPLAEGLAWKKFAGAKHAARRVLVVHADDLRHHGMQIARCPSWDRIVEDTHNSLVSGHVGSELLDESDDLVVLFDVEGAMVVTGNAANPSIALICDPMRAEYEVSRLLPGYMVGKMNCFLAALVNALPAPKKSLHDAVAKALLASRLYAESYFLEDGTDLRMPSVPNLLMEHEKRAAEAKPGSDHARYITLIPSKDAANISLLATSVSAVAPSSNTPDVFRELGRRIIVEGVERVLENLPHGRFKELWTVDREEIEGLRAIDVLIKDYLARTSLTKPLSIAVFGPPGAGKSFGVKQLVSEDEVPILEFNLSQADEVQLPRFFHDIRDANLKGKTPLCFFDEFDSRDRELVKYFLAPMQDGLFREGDALRPVGRGIFVFAGGTVHRMQDFCPRIPANAEPEEKDPHGQDQTENKQAPSKEVYSKEDKRKKLPDFVSRLSGFLNIKGPDPQTEPTGATPDHEHLLRRAILIRRQIEKHLPCIISEGGKTASIEPALVDALLIEWTYRHGARSIELVLRSMASGPEKTTLGLSDLPIASQLNLHVALE
ncbi:hypothetical protein [Rhodobium gokarnense]|uniref:ATPase AAA-type core domain-containing protein n=1 Tax=Rhodobium gokarnense TaxID=364296 RepID=A0ABT3HF37_9HYPH|nr:hypothetical protein [Rhodobium gokarnense]MCW2309013.1 hypothetical protein [Rhodobium gokarnense]